MVVSVISEKSPGSVRGIIAFFACAQTKQPTKFDHITKFTTNNCMKDN